MHYEEQRLMEQQLSDAQKIIGNLEALDKLSEPTVKDFASVMRQITEWTKKAPCMLTDIDWMPLATAHVKMLEIALQIGEKLIHEAA